MMAPFHLAPWILLIALFGPANLNGFTVSASASDLGVSDDSAAVALQVYPPQVTTSRNHPAHLAVSLLFADGTSRDVSHDPSLLHEFDQPQIASLAHPISPLALPQVQAGSVTGSTTLHLAWGHLSTTLAVENRAASDEPILFTTHVAPVLAKAGCNMGTCHGNLHGKGGFRLSLRGDDPQFDWLSLTQLQQGRRLDPFDPSASLLLRKPSGALPHLGGVRYSESSISFTLLREWIAAGAPAPSSAPQEKVVALQTFPAEAWLPPTVRAQPLIVIATLADGSHRDVTPWARYEASIVSGVEISSDGQVAVSRPLDVGISVSYLDTKSQARLVFLEKSNVQEATSPNSPIDQIINDRLQRLRIAPLSTVTDDSFLRRLFLSAAGRLPSLAEYLDYQQTPPATRRQVWIERALHDPGYADLWAMHWSDLLRNEQKVMSPEGAQRWNSWLRDQFANDLPLDEFIRQSVSTTGSTYEQPAASFHRTHRQPDTAAEALGQVFLGVRIQCARCHNHPFDHWKQDDYYGLAAYFTTIERKQIDNMPRDGLDSHVITGDEIISLSEKKPRIEHPGLSQYVSPKPLDVATWDKLDDVTSPNDKQPLQALAQWLTTNNRAMARNLANRVWFHLMGRGIVDPPDDFRSSNPPSHPELLEYLTDRLIASGFSTRALSREILMSDAFARTSISQSSSPDSLDRAAVFAGYPLRRMSAEVLLDAISDATGVSSTFQIPEQKEPTRGRAVTFAAIPRDGFLKTFGKPDRLLSCECERSADASLSQALQLLNGDEIRKKISKRPNRIELVQQSIDSQPEDNSQDLRYEQFVNTLYISVLTRLPTANESAALVDHLTQSTDQRAAAEDILWALINSQEFPWIR